MQWEKASKNALIFVMIRSMLMIAGFLFALLYIDSNLSQIFSIFGMLASAVALRNAYVLDETPGPIMSIGPQGIVVSPALSAGRLIPWDDVRSVKNYTTRIYLVIPIYNVLIIRVRGRHYLSALQLWGQGGWFSSAITIPAAYFRDGTGATLLMKARCETMREQARHALVGQAAAGYGGGGFGTGGFGSAAPAGAFPQPGLPATAHVAQAVANSDERPDLDAAVARYFARRAADAASLDSVVPDVLPAARGPLTPPAPGYVPPGSADYVPRRTPTTPEPLLNGKPFPKEDRPVFGRRSL